MVKGGMGLRDVPNSIPHENKNRVLQLNIIEVKIIS